VLFLYFKLIYVLSGNQPFKTALPYNKYLKSEAEISPYTKWWYPHLFCKAIFSFLQQKGQISAWFTYYTVTVRLLYHHEIFIGYIILREVPFVSLFYNFF